MSESVSAAVLVIGDEILSGRTKDANIGHIAERCGEFGIDLREVRIVADDQPDIVAALNALRTRYDYVFTTGGIGPTHDDITADAVAAAFGVNIAEDPRAIALLLERIKPEDLNAARRRMARIPHGADLVENNVSKAPGFWIGNVIVMAGVPRIMQAMLDSVMPKLAGGVRTVARTVDARSVPEGTYAAGLEAIATGPRRHQRRLLSLVPGWTLPQRDRRSRQVCGRGRTGGDGRGSACRRTRGTLGAMTIAGPTRRFPISWEQFHRDCRALAWRLSGLGPFAAMVTITRGGLVPAAIVARELSIHVIETIAISSYRHEATCRRRQRC